MTSQCQALPARCKGCTGFDHPWHLHNGYCCEMCQQTLGQGGHDPQCRDGQDVQTIQLRMMWAHSSEVNSPQGSAELAISPQQAPPMTATDARQPDDPLTPAPSGSRARAQPVPLPPWKLVRQWQTARPGAKEAAGLPVKEDGSPSSDGSEPDVPTPDFKKAKTETWTGPFTDRAASAYGTKPGRRLLSG